VATTVLTQLGLQVVDARDGSEGLAVYRQRQREVRGMLLDLTMPVMNGLDVMREVRATNPTLPIVLCSGYDRNEVLDQLAPDPCCVFLPKPFTAEQLERAVRAALS
jgi:CheY-like chemotaxis protein